MNVLDVLQTIEVIKGRVQLCVLVKEDCTKIKTGEEVVYDPELGNNVDKICEEALIQLDKLEQSMLEELKNLHKSEVKVGTGKSKRPRAQKSSSKGAARKSSGTGSGKGK